jgi:hypothetical protein
LKLHLIGRHEIRRRKAISSVLGGVILFSIVFTVGFGYFFVANQDQQILQIAQRQNTSFLAQKNEESLFVAANIAGGNMAFSVNNTGIETVLTAFFITDQSGKVLQYRSGTMSNASSCGAGGSIPCGLDPGASTVFGTKVTYITGNYYTIRVLTSRGTTIVGTYPTQQLTTTAITSLVASGLGSLQMVFRSFSFYNYSSTGSPNWKINLSSAQTAAITPFSKHMAMSAQITNNDPSQGTIVVDSHTDLWTFLSCSSGCGTQPLIPFYIVNVAPDGTVMSTTQGSFVPIQIPYGATQTVFFASACDLSVPLSSCTSGSSYLPQSIGDAIGEHDVFMIFSGTLVAATNSTLYSQNLPFTATFVSDNIATFSQTPTTCANGSSTSFTLTVTNTKWTPSGHAINTITLNAGSFNPTGATGPSGWTPAINGGIITWTAQGSPLAPGKTVQLTWTGTAPVVETGTQVIFLSTANWNGGTVVTQPIDTGCFVG